MGTMSTMSDKRITTLLDRAAAIAARYGDDRSAAEWRARRDRYEAASAADEPTTRPSGRTRGSLSAALLAGAPSRTGRPTPEEHAAGVRRPASGVTMGVETWRARDGPARTG